MMTLDGMVRVAAVGGGMIVDGSKFMADGLVRLAGVAAGNGSHIIIKNPSGFMLEDLVRIGAAGRGAVIFDLFDE